MSGPGTVDELEWIAASLGRARGEHFFRTLAQQAAELLAVPEVHVTELTTAQRLRSLAVWRSGAPFPNYERDVRETPCARLPAGTPAVFGIGPAERGVPDGATSCAGVALTSNDGAILGHLAAFSPRPIVLDPRRATSFAILAGRAAAELRLVHVKRERAQLRSQLRLLRAEIEAEFEVDTLAGVSAAQRRVTQEVERLAESSAALLITGEPGTGKEHVARAMHAAGPRADDPFVKVDCTALDCETRIRALSDSLPALGACTVLLDEIAALPVACQNALLVAFGARGDEPSAPQARLVSTTARDLRARVRAGEFRDDLLQRISGAQLDLPPLRARGEDIPGLVDTFVRKHARRLGRRVDGVDPDALADLARHAWPGNVRELESVIERALLANDAPLLKISTSLLAPTVHDERSALAAAATGATASSRMPLATPVDFDETLSTGLHVVQREHILRILDATRWVIEGNAGAAVKLGMKPATLRHRMKKLGIARPEALRQ